MANANNVINVAQGKLEKLVRQDTPCICEAKQTVICEHSPQPHSSGM